MTTSVLMPEPVDCPPQLEGAGLPPGGECEASKILVHNTVVNYGGLREPWIGWRAPCLYPGSLGGRIDALHRPRLNPDLHPSINPSIPP